MFPSTQPNQAATLSARASRALGRQVAGLGLAVSSRLPASLSSRFGISASPSGLHGGGSTALSSLSPSLLQDLLRFERTHGEQRELLEVLAACIRHTQPLAIRVDTGSEWVTLSVYPIERLVHCRAPLERVFSGVFAQGGLGLRVVHVQPATQRLPTDMPALLHTARVQGYAPLGPLMWAVALAGSRATLLPELAGHAAYRVAAGVSLAGLPVPQELVACIQWLRRETCNLQDIIDWPMATPEGKLGTLGRERAVRLLNGLYLQSALIVTRSHPAATNENWRGYDKVVARQR